MPSPKLDQVKFAVSNRHPENRNELRDVDSRVSCSALLVVDHDDERLTQVDP